MLAVFDLDGTILDTLEDLAGALNFALAAHGFPLRTVAETRRFVGHGIRNLVGCGCPEGTGERTQDAVLASFAEYYRAHSADRTKPYPGIVEMLTALRQHGIGTAVVSNKADFAVQVLCRRFFPDLFDFVTGERQGVAKKPAPDLVFQAMTTLHAQRQETVYIGDSDVDFQTASNAEVRPILVTWGFRDEALLRNFSAPLAKSVAELQEMLLA